jgi:CDP-diacylglycerol--glycerol-3-phosphate 3-phosphatidyltransferase
MYLSRLRRRWIALVVLQILLVTAVTWLLITMWDARAAYQWLVLASIGSTAFFGYLWRHLPINHPPGVIQILPNFGPGNLLTIARGMLLMLLAGFMFSPLPPGWLAYLPGLLYAIASFADIFDGYLARISKQPTRLGEELDLSLDGLGLLIASILLVWYGHVPAWYLLVGLARYLFLFGDWWRRRAGRPVYPLGESSARRPFAGAQMGFAAVMLFPVFSPPGTYLAAALFALPFLIGFFLDWLTISGFSSSNFVKQNFVREKSLQESKPPGTTYHVLLLRKWLPLIVRIVLAVLLLIWLFEKARLVFASPVSTINQNLAEISPVIWAGLLLLLICGGLVLVILGAAGRAAALLVLFGLGMYLEVFQLGLIEILIVFAATGLFYLGTGSYSIWIPEMTIITRRLGES